jgi:hypothetical protein
MNQTTPTTPERGTMLIELVYAAAVALVVGGSVIVTTVRQNAHRAVNLETTLATNAIADVFARLRAMPFADLPSIDGTGFDVPGQTGRPAALNALPGDADGLPGEIHVTVETTAGATVLYRVTLNVVWTGAIGQRRETVIGLVGERRS